MGKKYWYFRLAKLVPPSLVKAMAFKPLLRNDNAPIYWVNHGYKGHIKAFYGGEEAFAKLPREWSKTFLLCENRDGQGQPIDNEELKTQEWTETHMMRLNHGFDESKPSSELGLEDMKEAAAFRGGSILSESMKKGDLWTKLKWRCAEGHEFEATPFTILFGGFWCPSCEQPKPWATGRLAARSPFFAQVYFADHSKEETGDVFPLEKEGGQD